MNDVGRVMKEDCILQNQIQEYAVDGSVEGLSLPMLRLYDEANSIDDLYVSYLLAVIIQEHSSEAKNILGEGFFSGKGLVKNQDKAIRLFTASAQAGNVRGLYDNGASYYVLQEFARAVECLEGCLRIGGLDDSKIGFCYGTLGDSYSRLVVPNISKAVDNLVIAVNKYHIPNASFRLAQILLDQNSNNERKKAIPYLEEAAKNGIADAASTLARFYIFGSEDLEIEPDKEKAEQLLLPFSQVEHTDVQYLLAQLYLFGVSGEGSGASREPEKAIKPLEWLWNSSHSAIVANKLGYAYYMLDRNQEAIQYWEYADKDNQCSCLDFLGRLYVSERNNRELGLCCYDRAYRSSDGLNNRFVYAEYIDLLIHAGRYSDAFDIAVEGESLFNDIEFIFRQAKLVLLGHHQVSNSYRFVQMMQSCLEFDGYERDARYVLSEYYASIGSCSEARLHLKILYERGEKNITYKLGLVSVDEPLLAIKWFTESFNEGNIEAALRIAEVYELRNNDPDNAYQWYLRAANAGNEEAAAEVKKFRKTMLGRYKRM